MRRAAREWTMVLPGYHAWMERPDLATANLFAALADEQTTTIWSPVGKAIVLRRDPRDGFGCDPAWSICALAGAGALSLVHLADGSRSELPFDGSLTPRSPLLPTGAWRGRPRATWW